jgi:hypothetical protein
MDKLKLGSEDIDESTANKTASADPPQKAVKRFVGRKRAEATKASIASDIENLAASGDLVGTSSPSKQKNRIFQAIPPEILENEDLNQDLKALPVHYNFEIHKTIWRIKQAKAKTVALQLPEGLQLFACTLADIIGEYAGVEVIPGPPRRILLYILISCSGGDSRRCHVRCMLRRRPECTISGMYSMQYCDRGRRRDGTACILRFLSSHPCQPHSQQRDSRPWIQSRERTSDSK